MLKPSGKCSLKCMQKLYYRKINRLPFCILITTHRTSVHHKSCQQMDSTRRVLDIISGYGSWKFR